MDISKLPIQIADPAGEAEKNVSKVTPEIYSQLSWPCGMPDFRNIKKNDGLGRVLLTVMRYPNMSWIHIYNGARLRYFGNDYIQLAHFAGLITNKVPKKYKGSNPGYRITELGKRVLKQNGLID